MNNNKYNTLTGMLVVLNKGIDANRIIVSNILEQKAKELYVKLRHS